ncbi:MAG TPA: DUF4845 domain-containing protein [Gammaproteobacteria bacterium]|nr:DUF4845 domain-containing protein [Gammaproteobacteria bacterium]
MAMRKHQTGLTMISWIILIGLIGFVGIFGFKLIPIYLDYFAVNRAMITAVKNLQSGESPQQIRIALSGVFDVNSVNVIKPDDVEIKIDPDTKAVVMNVNYDARTNFIANIDLVVHFEKSYPASVR